MILEVNGLHTYYGASHILFGISISIDEGETVSLLGRNGAGKTTTLSSIMGMVPPYSGSIKFMGVEIAGKPIERIARMGIGFVPEDRRIFADLTVLENLQVPVRHSYGGWTEDDTFDLFPVLGQKTGDDGGSLSGGEQQMLAIARTLMISPRLLLLDEPAEGLSPIVLNDLTRGMRKLKERGITILLAEQRTEFAINLSERAYILEKGVIRYQGTIEGLRSDEEVKKKYLAV